MARGRRRRRAQATLHGPRSHTTPIETLIINSDWMTRMWIYPGIYDMRWQLEGTADHGLNSWKRVWMN